MPETKATIETGAMPGIGSSELLARAARWEEAGRAASEAAPKSNADLCVAGFVTGLRQAAEYANELEQLLRDGLNTKPSTLGDWKSDVRRKFPGLAG